ncbi:MAG: DUF1440 domain-containing protein [Gemmatimonadetes bacterium]|nr:DUF1440 domain-containing protein [Gemmatimonadota bacterium]
MSRGEQGARITIDLAKGALAGAVAWWVMDQVLIFLYDHEDPAVRRRETCARRGIPALEVIAERGAAAAGIRLTEREREMAGTALQWTVGVGMGAVYGALRGRLPAARAGRGLGYGAVASLLVDEGLIPLFGLAPGPEAFPWQTHARGFVGHLVYGAVAEAVLSRLGGIARTDPGADDRERTVGPLPVPIPREHERGL